jgi:hypothetical protein
MRDRSTPHPRLQPLQALQQELMSWGQEKLRTSKQLAAQSLTATVAAGDTAQQSGGEQQRRPFLTAEQNWQAPSKVG